METTTIRCIRCHKQIICPSSIYNRIKDKLINRFRCSYINWDPTLSNFTSKKEIKELCDIDAGYLHIPIEYQIL